MNEKACSNCKEVKAFSEFSVDKSAKFSLSYYCKACAKAKASNWYLNNLLKAKESRKDYQIKNAKALSVRRKEWQEKNKKSIKVKKEIYYMNNRQICLKKMKVYRDLNSASISKTKIACRLKKLDLYKSKAVIYRNNHLEEKKLNDKTYSHRQATQLTTVYVTKSLSNVMPREAITPEIIETKRMHLKLHRLIKELKK